MNRTPIEEVGWMNSSRWRDPVRGGLVEQDPVEGLVEQDPMEGWLNSSRWRLDEKDPVEGWMNSRRLRGG